MAARVDFLVLKEYKIIFEWYQFDVIFFEMPLEIFMADSQEGKFPVKKEMVPTSLRIDKEVLKAVDEYAFELERSRNWVVNRLLKQTLTDLNKL